MVGAKRAESLAVDEGAAKDGPMQSPCRWAGMGECGVGKRRNPRKLYGFKRGVALRDCALILS